MRDGPCFKMYEPYWTETKLCVARKRKLNFIKDNNVCKQDSSFLGRNNIWSSPRGEYLSKSKQKLVPRLRKSIDDAQTRNYIYAKLEI